MMSSRSWALALLVACCSSLSACGVKTKSAVVEEAFEDEERRKEMMKATLRVMDEDLRYVDEMFVLARDHPRVMERFMADAARALEDPQLAETAAPYFVKWDASLKEVLVETLREAKDDPEARQAIASAVQTEADIAADIFVDDPDALATILQATLKAAKEDPETASVVKELTKEVLSP